MGEKLGWENNAKLMDLCFKQGFKNWNKSTSPTGWTRTNSVWKKNMPKTDENW